MKIVAEEKLLASDLPRSILFMALGKGHALLVGMGDGQLAHWQVPPPSSLSPFHHSILPWQHHLAPCRRGTTA